MIKISDIAKKSRPVIVLEHQERWVSEYLEMGNRLRSMLGDTVLRIDHIGSTSVPSLAAKDIIDIQITVKSLDNTDEFEGRMINAFFRKRGDIQFDNFCGITHSGSQELRKKYFREPEGERRCHIHVREMARLNQRYALLFKDYLRSNDVARIGYEIIKKRLSEIFPESIDGYLYVKDPLMDIIFSGAESWALNTNWSEDRLHL